MTLFHFYASLSLIYILTVYIRPREVHNKMHTQYLPSLHPASLKHPFTCILQWQAATRCLQPEVVVLHPPLIRLHLSLQVEGCSRITFLGRALNWAIILQSLVGACRITLITVQGRATIIPPHHWGAGEAICREGNVASSPPTTPPSPSKSWPLMLQTWTTLM